MRQNLAARMSMAGIMLGCALIGSVVTMGLQALRPVAAGATPAPVGHQKAITNAESGTESGRKARMGKPVVHFEIGCTDSAKTSDFYSKLFDWQIHHDGPGSTIDTGAGSGIQGHITSLGHEPQHYVTVYIEVEDIKTYIDRAVKLGGKMVVPSVAIPTGHFGWISDPDGNLIGLLQPKPKAKE